MNFNSCTLFFSLVLLLLAVTDGDRPKFRGYKKNKDVEDTRKDVLNVQFVKNQKVRVLILLCLNRDEMFNP